MTKVNPIVFVSTHPFGECCIESLELLYNNGFNVNLNPYGRRIKPLELKALLTGVDALIAGTEKLDNDVLSRADQLKIIARVGIGVDGIDWDHIKNNNIVVTYTPDAPTRVVAELTISMIIASLRKLGLTHYNMKNNIYKRNFGTLLYNKKIGIIGLGRIGKTVVKLLVPFECKIFAIDIKPDYKFAEKYNVKIVEKSEIYKSSDIISLHIPSTKLTRNLINEEVYSLMNENAYLINTSRGDIVDEDDLYNALGQGTIAGAAIDVYPVEPYHGKLLELENILFTCHMGASTIETRFRMELEAATEIVRFFKGEPALNIVPDDIRKY